MVGVRKKRKRPGYYRCGKMVLSDAQKALAMAKYLKTIVNVEIKHFDVQQTSAAIGTTPIITQLSNIPQGDTTITRDGNQCKVLGIDFGFVIAQHASATISTIRVMLVCDNQTNGVIYVAGDLLEDVTATDAVVSPRNLDNSRRFQVLYDRFFQFTDNGHEIQVVRPRSFKVSKMLRFDGSTPSIADLTEKSLSLFAVSSEATNTVAMTSFTRLRFVDN